MAGELDDLGFEEEADLSDLGFEPEAAPVEAAPAIQPEPLPQPAPRKPMPGWLSALGGASQGISLGFVDEVAGARDAGLSALLNAAAAANTGNLDYLSRIPSDAQRVYSDSRDTARGTLQQAREDNSKAFFAGELGGGILTAPVTGGAGLRSAASSGAAAGLGASEEDDLMGLARDTAGGAALGAAGQKAGEAAGNLLGRFVVPRVQQGASALRDGAASMAEERAVKAATGQNKRAILSMIDKDQLNRVGRDLLDEGVVTAGATTDDIFERASTRASEAVEAINRELSVLDAFPGASVGLVDDVALAAERNLIQPMSAGPVGQQQVAARLAQEVEALRNLGPEPTLLELENFRRGLDKSINWDSPEPPMVQEGLRRLRGLLNERIGERARQVAEANGSQAADLYGAAKGVAGSMISARDASKRLRSGELSNRLVSPSDYGTGATGALLGSLVSGGDVASAGMYGLAAGGLNNLARSRGNQVAAVGLDAIADSDWLRAVAETDPKAVEAFLGRAGAAAGRTPEARAVSHWEASATDPDYQRLMQKMGERGAE